MVGEHANHAKGRAESERAGVAHVEQCGRYIKPEEGNDSADNDGTECCEDEEALVEGEEAEGAESED